MLSSDGWSEGAARMRETMAVLTPPRSSATRRRPCWSEDGDDFDRDRWRAGREDCWRSTRRQRAQGATTCRLYVGITAGNRTTSTDFFWSGAVACVASDALESVGIRCEIVAYDGTEDAYRGNINQMLTVRLKGSDEPLCIERLAAWTATPLPLRWLSFAYRMTCPWRAEDNMGHSANERFLELSTGDIVIPRVTTESAARTVFAKIMARFNDDKAE